LPPEERRAVGERVTPDAASVVGGVRSAQTVERRDAPAAGSSEPAVTQPEDSGEPAPPAAKPGTAGNGIPNDDRAQKVQKVRGRGSPPR
jgi:hypothetical protein